MSTAVTPDRTPLPSVAVRTVTQWCNGKPVAGTSGRSGDVYNPATGHVQAKVPLANRVEMDLAVAAAEAAFPAWAAQPPLRRARGVFRLRGPFERALGGLGTLITAEHGKGLSGAKGGATRGVAVVGVATGIA